MQKHFVKQAPKQITAKAASSPMEKKKVIRHHKKPKNNPWKTCEQLCTGKKLEK